MLASLALDDLLMRFASFHRRRRVDTRLHQAVFLDSRQGASQHWFQSARHCHLGHSIRFPEEQVMQHRPPLWQPEANHQHYLLRKPCWNRCLLEAELCCCDQTKDLHRLRLQVPWRLQGKLLQGPGYPILQGGDQESEGPSSID